MSLITRKQPAAVERVAERPVVAPAVDVYENEREVLLVADLPGVKPDDLRIDLRGDELTLDARRPGDVEGSALATERVSADFHRVFTLPTGLDRAGIDAELAMGVLRLRLPKSAERQPRTIAVRGG